MPTGTCNFPEHHGGPSAGPPLGLIAAILAGALILAHWHAVVLVLAVVGVLAAGLVAVVMLWHSAHSAPYDAAWHEDSEPAAIRMSATVGKHDAAALLRAQQAIGPAAAEVHVITDARDAREVAGLLTDGQEAARAWTP